MPLDSELNTFRRLVGDYEGVTISNGEVVSWLDDCTLELTGNFSTPLTRFDISSQQYHTEIIYKAALNWWWNQLSMLQGKHSMSIGQMSQQTSEKWQRAMEMINFLQDWYREYQTLGFDIHVDDQSRFSKLTLRRIGGIPEEDTPGWHRS